MSVRTAVIIICSLFAVENAAGQNVQSVTYSCHFGFNKGGVTTLCFPQLDPSLGAVTSFSDQLTVSRGVTSATLENLSSTAGDVVFLDSLNIIFPGFVPNGGGVGTGVFLEPFDGVSDFSGSDSASCGLPPLSMGGSSGPSYYDFTPLEGTGTFPVSIERSFSAFPDAAYRIDFDGGTGGTYQFTLTYAVPEPSTVVHLGVAGIFLTACAWRRRRPMGVER
jgi:hypothetical protein